MPFHVMCEHMPIVAAVDHSERAEAVLEQAAGLADALDTALHVAHVGSVGVPTISGGFDPDRDRQYAGQQARGVARKLAEDVGAVGEFEPVGLAGDPAEAVLEHSREVDADYIVVSGRKRSAVGQAVFGSFTQQLLLEADRPVVAAP